MSKIQTLTDELLRTKLKQSLPEFIADQVKIGSDAYAIQTNLMIVTGVLYDRRMVVTWMDTYK